MSPIVEFEGKTVEMAVQRACESLNIPEKKLKHDIISHGSSGIFGLVGAKKAKIRVTVPEKEKAGKKKRPEEKKRVDDAGVRERVAETFDDQEQENVTEELVQIGKDALRTMIDQITSDAVIDVDSNGERIFYNVTGGNTAILIGKRGQTLEAMQYLVEKIVNKQGGKRVRIEVDVEGYLENKRQKLEALALKLSEKVKRTNKPATVGQLNAYDRRIVHLALKADGEIRT
ncbi:MAG: Jag N-terminal domain-containing protein, partial [Deltaproteobacteria bacterium]|nr:Jag N-terminal domain-containing protein [Deltaproteobacteria bacterium]